jgi:hypothetical protein
LQKKFRSKVGNKVSTQTATSKKASVPKKAIAKKSPLTKIAVDHEPPFFFPPGKTSFDKDSDAEDFMGRVSHRVSNKKR